MRKETWVLTVVLAAALLAGACGGNDASPDASADGTTLPSEPPDGDASSDATGSTGAAVPTDGASASECPVTTDEIDDLVGSDGWSGGDGVETLPGGVGCTFVSGDQADTITISTIQGPMATQAFAGLRQEQLQDGAADESALDGISGEAYAYDQGGVVSTIALDGDRVALVIASGGVSIDVAARLLSLVLEQA